MKKLKQIDLSRVFVPEAGGVDFFGHELSFFFSHGKKSQVFRSRFVGENLRSTQMGN